jgi:large subunit ribosomal protein L22
MSYTNVHRGARISPTKARLVTTMIQNKPVDQAMVALDLSKKRAAVFVKSALKAAVANADQAEADVRTLVVTEARVDSGPTMKRFQPKDRGRAHPILKRTSHITVTVDAKRTGKKK